SSPARPAGPLRAESEPGPESSPALLSECSYFASVVDGVSTFIGERPVTAPHTRRRTVCPTLNACGLWPGHRSRRHVLLDSLDKAERTDHQRVVPLREVAGGPALVGVDHVDGAKEMDPRREPRRCSRQRARPPGRWWPRAPRWWRLEPTARIG